MKKKIKLLVATASVIVAIAVFAHSEQSSSVYDVQVMKNAKALSMRADTVCTGPKILTPYGSMCECMNDMPCRDVQGCQ